MSRKQAFVTVDAWRNDLEKERMLQWDVTGLTYIHTDKWKDFFLDVGYNGGYYWFIAE